MLYTDKFQLDQVESNKKTRIVTLPFVKVFIHLLFLLPIGTNLGAAMVDMETGMTSWVCRSKSDILAQQVIHSVTFSSLRFSRCTQAGLFIINEVFVYFYLF